MASSGDTGRWWDTQLDWTKEHYEDERRRLGARSPALDGVDTYKVLMVGPTKVGKSSVVNTFLSALRNEICQVAHNAHDEKSVTNKFRVYRLRESLQKRGANVMLCDTMGFEQSEEVEGPTIRDVTHIMDGQVKDGYQFELSGSISHKSDFFEENPKPEDKVHVVLLVLDSSTVSQMMQELLRKLKEITRAALDRDIHWAVVMTKVDEACPDVDKDLTEVYQSKNIKEIMLSINETIGANPFNIHPMQNYSHEMSSSLEMNALALHVLDKVLNLADNTLEAQAQKFKADEPEKVVIPLLTNPWLNSKTFEIEDIDKDPAWEEVLSISSPGLKVMLLGPAGAGKSAFINSAMSTFYNRIVVPAETGKLDTPITKYYTEHQLKEGRDNPAIPFWLCDTRGMATDGTGIHMDDVEAIISGQLPNKTPFNTGKTIDMSSLGVPTAPGALRIAALVLDITAIDNLSMADIGKIMDMLSCIKRKDMAYVVLLTHIDLLCPHVRNSVKHVYNSQLLHEAIMKVQKKLQVPKLHILPIYNFHSDTQLDSDRAALVLHTLLHMYELSMDYANQQEPPPAQQQKSLIGKLASSMKFW